VDVEDLSEEALDGLANLVDINIKAWVGRYGQVSFDAHAEDLVPLWIEQALGMFDEAQLEGMTAEADDAAEPVPGDAEE